MLPEDRVVTLALFEIFLYVDELLQWISIVASFHRRLLLTFWHIARHAVRFNWNEIEIRCGS